MKLFLVVLVNLFTILSEARAQTPEPEVLTCLFVEPTFSITFDSETKHVLYEGDDPFDETNATPVKLTLSEKGQLVTKGSVYSSAGFLPQIGYQAFLFDEKNQLILEMKLTFDGSDGETQKFYPFEAIHSTGHNGACYSTSALPVDPVHMFERLRNN